MKHSFTIGHLAEQAGRKVQTVRYYEQISLLRIPERSEGNQRLYGQVDIDRLALIRHSRALGFPLEANRDLPKLADDPIHSVALLTVSRIHKSPAIREGAIFPDFLYFRRT